MIATSQQANETNTGRAGGAPLVGNDHVLDHLAALDVAHRVEESLNDGEADPDEAARRALELAAARSGRPARVCAQDALGLWAAEHHHRNPLLRAQAERALDALSAH